ncbi:MAG: (2Fe-2S)-binding protein [Oscillospiraceae bacterium]|nr:(2Fe-2S)-binding protein [Oscillospiraceae bacterium]
MSIPFTLNGAATVYAGSATDRLLDVLRADFQCPGVKSGCNEGECGACSVILDGVLVNACMVAMGRVVDAEITTIEGFRETARFEALNKAFGETGAVQCGFCTPGMILAAECVLRRNPEPSEAEIREGLSGNMCRCTGYNSIVNAVALAAKEGRGLW